MLRLRALGEQVREALFLGAHCDDVEIGCGGLLASLRAARPELPIHVAVFSSDAIRKAETEAAIARLAAGRAGLTLHCFEFRDGYFPAQWPQIKDRFTELQALCRPDLVLTHHGQDLHQDHRIVSELTWNTFRDHLVLEYEIPKFDGDLGRPGVYVPLTEEAVRLKTSALLECFASQANKPWFTADTFNGLMRLRGLECRSPSGFAEAFFGRKVVLDCQ